MALEGPTTDANSTLKMTAIAKTTFISSGNSGAVKVAQNSGETR